MCRAQPHLVPLAGNDGAGFGVMQQDAAVQKGGVLGRKERGLRLAQPGLPPPNLVPQTPSAAHLNPHQLGQLPLRRLKDAARLAALVGPEGAPAGGRLVLTVAVFTGAGWLLPGLLSRGLCGARPVTSLLPPDLPPRGTPPVARPGSQEGTGVGWGKKAGPYPSQGCLEPH